MNGTDAAKARFIHRQTMANAMRFTTTELAGLESKIANARRQGAGDRARRLRPAGRRKPSRQPTRSAPAPRRSPCSTCRRRSPASPAAEDYARPAVDGSLAFEIEAGRHPVVEQALRRQAEGPSSPTTATSRPRRREERRDLAAHRPEHGRQVDLPAPERADRHPRADGRLRAGDSRPYRRRRPAVLARRRVGRSGARPLDLHGRDGRDRGDPQPGRRERRSSSSTRSAAAPRPSTACRSPGRRSSTCTSTTGARAIFATHFHEMTALPGKLSRLHNVTMR